MSDDLNRISDHPLDDLAAYALDALDDAERQLVDDHLAGCDTCRAELAGHLETLAALAPAETPPAAVWQNIAASIGPPASDLSGVGHGDNGVGTVSSLTTASEARARRPSRPRWLAAAACLVAAAMTGGFVGFSLGSSGDDSGDIGSLAQRASEEPGGVLGTLANTGGQPVARVVADQDGAFIVLEGLQDLPEGRAYQLWSLSGPQPVSLGMLGRDGTNTVAFRLPPTITELAISVEPTSGEVAPSGEFQASGSITATNPA